MKIFKPNRGKDFVKGSERAGEITATYMSDDFTGNDGDPPDPIKWPTIFASFNGDASGDATIQNNKLQLQINGTDLATDLGFVNILALSPGLLINGDFSVYADFDIETLTINDSSAVEVIFQINNDLVFFRVEIAASLVFRKYTISIEADYASIDTTDLSGKFRIDRIGDNIKFWIWKNNQWEWDGDTDGYNHVMVEELTDPLNLFLGFVVVEWAPAAPPFATNVKVFFDNFIGPSEVESNRAMYVFDKEAQSKVFKSFNKKVRRPKIWR